MEIKRRIWKSWTEKDNKKAIRETEETRYIYRYMCTHIHRRAWAPNHLNWVQIKNHSSVWLPSNYHAGSVKTGWLSSFGLTTVCLQISRTLIPHSPNDSQLLELLWAMMLIMHLTFFYTKKQGQIRSLLGLRLQTGWQVDGVIWK